MFDDPAVGWIIFIIVLLLAIVIFVPLLTIWSLNTLFGLAIGYSLKTWFASLILGGLVGGSAVTARA